MVPVEAGSGVDLNDYETELSHLPTIHKILRPTGHGRRYIPHGFGTSSGWVPHNVHIDPEYTQVGPDWSSQLRWLPHPQNPQYPAPENWPTKWHSLKYYPWTYVGSSNEWQIHPMESSVRTGRKCLFTDGDLLFHKATCMTYGEITHTQKFGCRRKGGDINARNGIWQASPGDKSYPVPECSSDFHKKGSTRPLSNFSHLCKNVTDTFVPLQKLPSIYRDDYNEHEKKMALQEEVDCVRSLDYWCPAIPLAETLPVDEKHVRRVVDRHTDI